MVNSLRYSSANPVSRRIRTYKMSSGIRVTLYNVAIIFNTKPSSLDISRGRHTDASGKHSALLRLFRRNAVVSWYIVDRLI